MTYDEFKQAVCQNILHQLPSDTSVQLQQIYKNNGLKLDGLMITKNQCNVSPTIFLNYYYEKQNLFPDFDAICKDILLTYEQNQISENIAIDFFTDYEKVKSHLAFRIINYEKNKELLQTVPHICYLDLAIVFYCLLQITDKGHATILIHSNHMKLWNVTAAALYEQTCRTTPILLPYDFKSLASVLAETFESNSFENSSFFPMYVLTNTSKLYGASCILYPRLLQTIAQNLDTDLFILPSSIHEIIILPATSRFSRPKELADMVASINTTELSIEEVLSDHIYYYSKAKQKLCICTEPAGC